MLDLNLILCPKILASKLIEVLGYNFIIKIFKYVIIFILLSKVVD